MLCMHILFLLIAGLWAPMLASGAPNSTEAAGASSSTSNPSQHVSNPRASSTSRSWTNPFANKSRSTSRTRNTSSGGRQWSRPRASTSRRASSYVHPYLNRASRSSARGRWPRSKEQKTPSASAPYERTSPTGAVRYGLLGLSIY